MAQIDDDALAKQFGAVNTGGTQQAQPTPQGTPQGAPQGTPQGVPQAQGQGVDDDALAKQFGAVNDAGVGQPAADTGDYLSHAEDFIHDASVGVSKGAMATVHTVGEGIRKGMNVGSNLARGSQIGMGNLGDKIVPPQGQAALDSIATPQGTGQKTGFGAEALLEMMLPDGILKDLSLAERLGLAQKIAKMAQDHPIVGKILAHGLDAVRMGTAQTTENIAKGQPVGQAIKEGATTAAIGTGFGALGSVASHAFNPETGLVTKLAQGENMAQRPAQIAMRNAAGEQGTSVRALLTNSINRAKSIAKSGYEQVEKATGVDLKVLQQKLDNTIEQLNELTETEPDIAKEAQLEASRTSLMDQVDEATQRAVKNGVPADAIDKADAAWKKHMALSDVNKAVFKNEGVLTGNTAHGSREMINVDAAIRNLEKLNSNVKYGEPRLQQALGADGADELMKEMYAAKRAGDKAVKAQDVAKSIAKYLKWTAITGGAGAAGGAVVKHVME